MKKNLFSVRDMCEIAMLVAISVVLDVIPKIQIGANGGSISFSMIPLLFIAYRHGVLKGFISGGIIFGLVTNIIDGYGFACYPFDYLLAVGSIAIVGLFYKPIFETESKWKPFVFICVSILLACTLRLAFHVISGMVLYETDFVGSFVYNVAYIGPCCALCMIAFCALFPFFKRLNKRYPVSKRI